MKKLFLKNLPDVNKLSCAENLISTRDQVFFSKKYDEKYCCLERGERRAYSYPEIETAIGYGFCGYTFSLPANTRQTDVVSSVKSTAAFPSPTQEKCQVLISTAWVTGAPPAGLKPPSSPVRDQYTSQCATPTLQRKYACKWFILPPHLKVQISRTNNSTIR